MRRIIIAIVLSAIPIALATGCSRSGDASPATTQAGAAASPPRTPVGLADGDCKDLPSADDLKKYLQQAPNDGGPVGGLSNAKLEWAAVVNREGVLCAAAVAGDQPAMAWLGSAAIAKAKAFTANAFSTDTNPLSTARLYTLAQPGHSLFGAGAANPFDPNCLGSASNAADAGKGKVCGGTIVFGGGVPLYKNNTRVGGLGASGDTACADHEMAKRMRHLAQLDPSKGPSADDIVYPSVDGPSEFAHPICDNTWRNGQKIGDEAKVKSY